MNAIRSYEKSFVEEGKWGRESLNDPELSVLPDLKNRVALSKEIESHFYSLLKATLAAHRDYLEKLKKLDEPWCNKAAVDSRLSEIDRVSRAFFSSSP